MSEWAADNLPDGTISGFCYSLHRTEFNKQCPTAVVRSNGESADEGGGDMNGEEGIR